MTVIQFVIEGQDAKLAATELVAIKGIQGNWKTDETNKKEGTIAVIASIIGIVGGTLAIAEQIRQWYQKYTKEKKAKAIDKVLIVCDGQRLLLENASIEQINQILENIAQK